MFCYQTSGIKNECRKYRIVHVTYFSKIAGNRKLLLRDAVTSFASGLGRLLWERFQCYSASSDCGMTDTTCRTSIETENSFAKEHYEHFIISLT
jgi:hypothetical protein